MRYRFIRSSTDRIVEKLDKEIIPVSAALEITLDSELRDALNRKSHQLDMEPEEMVRQLVRYFVQGQLALPNQEFAKGLTVAGYLSLNDEEEDTLWNRWFVEADQKVGAIIAEAGSDAVPPR